MLRYALVLACWAAAADAFAPASTLPIRAGSIRPLSRSAIRMQAETEQASAGEWLSATDESSGKTYYYNSVTKESRWDLPTAAAAPAPVEKATPKAAETKAVETKEAAKVSGFMLSKSSPLVYSDMAGNKGFDPLNLAKTQDKLFEYRQAELKHGRLAMLAAAGWPLSEYAHNNIAQMAKMPAKLAANGIAPSPIAGGLEDMGLFLGAAAGVAVVGEGLLTQMADKKAGHVGFDPLNCMGTMKTEEQRLSMENKELNHARLAMIGVASMAAQQAITKAPLLDF